MIQVRANGLTTVTKLSAKKRKDPLPENPYFEKIQFEVEQSPIRCRVTIEAILAPEQEYPSK